MVLGRFGKGLAIGLDLVGNGVIVIDVSDGLLVDLADERARIGSPQGLGRATQ